MPGGGAGLDLRVARHIHVIGVGGAGMSAIATVLAAMGHTVSGSDLQASAVTERLRGQGVTVMRGHAAANVAGADIVTASPAVGAHNVEMQEAVRLAIPIARRGEMLAAIADTRRTVAVAGTHGKTTTSSMLSLMLVEGGLRPSFLIGADVGELSTNAVWDDGDLLVLEADESYGTFSTLRPELTVLTNVEPDHLDHYGTVEVLDAGLRPAARADDRAGGGRGRRPGGGRSRRGGGRRARRGGRRGRLPGARPASGAQRALVPPGGPGRFPGRALGAGARAVQRRQRGAGGRRRARAGRRLRRPGRAPSPASPACRADSSSGARRAA